MTIVFTNGTSSFTILKDGITTSYRRNRLGTKQKSDDADALLIYDNQFGSELMFSIDVSVDTINVDGNTSWADAATLDAALEPLFFLTSSGGGSFTPTTTTYVESITTGDWVLDGSGRYYVDAVHNLNTKDLLIEAYNIATDDTEVLDDYERTGVNTVRIWSLVNTDEYEVTISNGGNGISVQSFSIEAEQTADFAPSGAGGKLYPVNSATDIDVTINTACCGVGEAVYFRQVGVGQVILVVGTATIPLDTFASLKSRGQYATIGVMNLGSGVYEVLGKTE